MKSLAAMVTPPKRRDRVSVTESGGGDKMETMVLQAREPLSV